MTIQKYPEQKANTTYEIGTRLRGFSKHHLKRIAKDNDIESKNKCLEKKYVPHVTFLRPFCIKENYNEGNLIKSFNNFCKKEKNILFKFNITDLGYFNNNEKIIFARINSRGKLEEFVQNMEESLNPLIDFKRPKIKKEKDPHIIPHITLFKSDEIKNFQKEFETIKNKIDFPIEQYMVRAYLLKKENNKKTILREYDFCLNKSLKRTNALDKEIFKKTIEEFERKKILKSSKDGFKKIKR